MKRHPMRSNYCAISMVFSIEKTRQSGGINPNISIDVHDRAKNAIQRVVRADTLAL